jgi:uncharacterized protein
VRNALSRHTTAGDHERRAVEPPRRCREADVMAVDAITTRVQPIERIDAVTADADDNRILECAVAAGSECIVSGDSDLLGLGKFRGIKIQRPAEFFGESPRR